MYENLDRHDLSQIFSESILMYEKQPVYVRDVDEDGLLDLEAFCSRKRMVVSPTDSGIDFTPIPLGMCNAESQAIFLSRIPKRQFKQGLCKQNLLAWTLDGAPGHNDVDYIMNRGTTSLSDTIRGQYPSIDEAVKMVTEGGKDSVAFNRYFAITADGEVFYKKTRVGMYHVGESKFMFLKSQEYLAEVLDYAIGK